MIFRREPTIFFSHSDDKFTKGIGKDSGAWFMFNLNLNNIKKPDETWCYVFGDGSSTKYFNLQNFANGPSISCGQLFLRNDFLQLDTRLISCIEPRIFWPLCIQNNQNLRDHHLLTKNLRKYIKSNPNTRFVINLSNYFFIEGKNLSFYHRTVVKKTEIINSVAKIMDPFGGSFTTQIILAYLLGYKKIYLVGFDAWTLNEGSHNRWFEFGKGDLIPNRGYSLDFLKIMSQVLEIEIISLKENLHPTLQSKTYEQHTGKQPAYQENFDLLTQQKIDLLGSHPRHKMYEH